MNRTSPVSARTSRRPPHLRLQSGWTLAEVTVASLMMTMLVSGVLVLVNAVSRTSDKHGTEMGMADDSRLAMDEVLYQLRAANAVVRTATLGGLTFTTSSEQLVFRAPGYHPSAENVVLPGVTDTIAFRFEAGPGGGGKLYETIVPGTGSIRPQRPRKVIADNVQEVVFQYKARDYWSGGPEDDAATFVLISTGSGRHRGTYTLRAKPVNLPVAFVNGAPRSSTGAVGSRYVAINDIVRGDEVQIVYQVNPADALDTGAAASVSHVDVTLRMVQRDSRRIERNQTLQGGARLRNVTAADGNRM